MFSSRCTITLAVYIYIRSPPKKWIKCWAKGYRKKEEKQENYKYKTKKPRKLNKRSTSVI